jgi:RNA:NAD 2'-phosphotransferase (TPT1/KptA family)
MAAQGVPFYVTDNGVWLTDAVPPEFLEDVVERG